MTRALNMVLSSLSVPASLRPVVRVRARHIAPSRLVDVLADELQDPEVRVQFRHVVTYQLTELRVFDLKNKNVRAAVRSGHRRGEWLLKTVRGFCRGFERNGGRVWEIFAPVSARTRLALDTLAHEVMHALLPGLKEIEVNAVASLGSALLWALGWRKKG